MNTYHNNMSTYYLFLLFILTITLVSSNVYDSYIATCSCGATGSCSSGVFNFGCGPTAIDWCCGTCPPDRACMGGNYHTSCNCGPGTASPPGSSSCNCQQCPPGEYQTTKYYSLPYWSQYVTICSSCPPNSYTTTYGNTACATCGPGEIYVSTTSACLTTPTATSSASATSSTSSSSSSTASSTSTSLASSTTSSRSSPSAIPSSSSTKSSMSTISPSSSATATLSTTRTTVQPVPVAH